MSDDFDFTHCVSCGREILSDAKLCPHCGVKQPDETVDYSKEDPYEVLQISRRAGKIVINAAYKTLARKYHPDSGDNYSDEQMKLINWAYEILSDKQKRDKWDIAHPPGIGGFHAAPTPLSPEEKDSSQVEDEYFPSEGQLGGQKRSNYLTYLSVALILLLGFSYFETKNAYNNVNNDDRSTHERLNRTIIEYNNLFTKTRFRGPFSGELTSRLEDEYGPDYGPCFGVVLKNFIVEVDFKIPNPDQFVINWEFKINFRNKGVGEQYQFGVTKEGKWFDRYGPTTYYKYEEGIIGSFNRTPISTNKLKLVIHENNGVLIVNDVFISLLDVSTYQQSGDICLSMNQDYMYPYLTETKIEYSNFKIFPLP